MLVLALCLGFSAVGIAWRAPVAEAATFSVSNGADSGPGSLRQAILDATSSDQDAVIEIRSGLTIALTGSELSFDPADGSAALTINGNGSSVERSGSGRFLHDQSSGRLALNDLTVTGAVTTGTFVFGGAVLAKEDVTIAGSSIEGTLNADGTTPGMSGGTAEGGAVDSIDGTLRFIDSTIVGRISASGANGGSAQGGAARSFEEIDVVNSTISGTITADGTSGTGGDGDGGALEAATIRISGSHIQGSTSGNSPLQGFLARGGAIYGDDVTISESTVTGTATATGKQGGETAGGAVHANAATVVDSSISGSVDSSGFVGGLAQGGGIYAGLVSTHGAHVHDSLADATSSGTDGGHAGGGGVFSFGGFSIVNTTIDGSAARATGAGSSASGGGIYAAHVIPGTATAINATVTNNVVSGAEFAAGGGMLTDGPLTIAYSDIVDNDAPTGANVSGPPPPIGGGTHPSLTAFGAVVSAASAGGTNCSNFETIDSVGYNFADDTSCSFVASTDQQTSGADPLLGPLTDNGGNVPTFLPEATSPLVDSVPEPACQTPPATGVIDDARGMPRPDALSGLCDIGAVEIQHPTTPPSPPTPPTSAPAAIHLEPRFAG